MVQAFVNISKETNWVLNVVKAMHGLKDKSQAIDVMAEEYADELLDRPLKASYVKKLKRLEKEPRVRITDFRKHFGLDT